MEISDWTQIHNHILQLEQEGLVTRTFRRLDPERQQVLLSAILDEAVEKGPTNLNIKQVAERAGVSVGALYTYFGNRENLLAFAVELASRYMTSLFKSFRPYLTTLSLRENLTYYLSGGVEWGQTQTSLLRFFARAAYHSDSEFTERLVHPVATMLRETVHAILASAVERGEIRDDVDLEASTRVIHALMIAVGDSQLLPYLNHYFQVTDEEMPPERVLDALLTLILDGVGTKT